VADAAARGVPVLGICNGFQVLTETGLLPGALMRNAGLNFVCRDVALTVDNSPVAFTSRYEAGETINSPSRIMTAIISPMPRRSTGSKAKAASRSAMPRGQRFGAQHRRRAQRKPAMCSA
jgi:hypothetical protein